MRRAQALGSASTDPTAERASTAPAVVSCWHGRDRWLASPSTPFASCPRFGRDRTAARYAHSHAMPACLTGVSTSDGTRSTLVVTGRTPGVRHANLLLLPWPLRLRESDFHPLDGSVQRLSKEAFGFFEFAPSERLDLDLVERLILAARDEVDSVDVVLLPECAVEEAEVFALEALLGRSGVTMLVAGVRQRSAEPG